MVISIFRSCWQDGITIIYIHYVDVFISFALYNGEFSAYIGVNLPSFVVLGYTVVQKNTFVLILSPRSVSGGFSLVD